MRPKVFISSIKACLLSRAVSSLFLFSHGEHFLGNAVRIVVEEASWEVILFLPHDALILPVLGLEVPDPRRGDKFHRRDLHSGSCRP